jgi:hypothetical protein
MNRFRLKDILLKNGIEYKCSECEISEWNNKKLSLHLDLINGINNDNRIDNLRFLCPNCHSLTDTYCGKNNGVKYSVKTKKITDETLLKSMKVSKTVVEALNNVGMAGAGNYNRIYKLAEIHKIEHLYSPKIKNEIIIQKLKNSNIDFSVFGWVEKASKIINITPQKTRSWIFRNCPELLENAFLRSK